MKTTMIVKTMIKPNFRDSENQSSLIGQPHSGHALALSDTCELQSGQFIRAIRKDF
ncbi:MAG: hypothetical protein KJP26_12685 [Maribacter sp.]|nr:hypothetical protein [Maribacter sp.]